MYTYMQACVDSPQLSPNHVAITITKIFINNQEDRKPNIAHVDDEA